MLEVQTDREWLMGVPEDEGSLCPNRLPTFCQDLPCQWAYNILLEAFCCVWSQCLAGLPLLQASDPLQ